MKNTECFTMESFLPNKSPYFHVAIIPDGARRWARINGKNFDEAYHRMVENTFSVANYLYSHGTDIITLYFSSIYNFKRPPLEVESFCNAEAYFLREFASQLAKQFELCVKVVGSKNGLSSVLLDAIEYIEQETRQYTEKKMFVCVKYSSMQEIEEACLSSRTSRNRPFVNNLWIPYPVNVLIRSGGAQVLSDFLLVQCASARLFFIDALFNDFTISEVKKIIEDYNGFELKYGE